jgi:hypothetical protein
MRPSEALRVSKVRRYSPSGSCIQSGTMCTATVHTPQGTVEHETEMAGVGDED